MRGKALSKAANHRQQLRTLERLFGSLSLTTPHLRRELRLDPAARSDRLRPRLHSIGIVLATLSNTCSHADAMQVAIYFSLTLRLNNEFYSLHLLIKKS